jgi:hypothetical protein
LSNSSSSSDYFIIILYLVIEYLFFDYGLEGLNILEDKVLLLRHGLKQFLHLLLLLFNLFDGGHSDGLAFEGGREQADLWLQAVDVIVLIFLFHKQYLLYIINYLCLGLLGFRDETLVDIKEMRLVVGVKNEVDIHALYYDVVLVLDDVEQVGHEVVGFVALGVVPLVSYYLYKT